MIYEALIRYFSCEAVARNDVSACNALPVSVGGEKGLMVRSRCAEEADEVMFSGYMAGKTESMSACKRFLSRSKTPQLRDNPEKFCPGFTKGLERVCDQAGERRKECLAAYPAKRSDCTEKPAADKRDTCADRYDIYSALRRNDYTACPQYYRSSCEAFFTQSRNSCAAAATEVSMIYCSVVNSPKVKPSTLRIPKGSGAN